VDPPRKAAYEALAATHRDDAYANIVLPRLLRESRISGRDAALATELTYGTLRSVGQLDTIIESAARRPVARIDPPARDALRLGAYQLLHTRIPPHAAVATTIDLVRLVAPNAVGFANAVLRRVAETDLAGWLRLVAPDAATDPVGHLAVTHAHPEWMVRAFADALGGDLTETEQALAANNDRPVVHLCARPGRITAAELASECGGLVGAYSPYTVYLPDGPPGAVDAVARGLAHVQDEGSQLVAAALTSAPVDGAEAGGSEGERWLDLCAGPGGKAALLASIAATRGARLTAVEIAPHRVALLRRSVGGLPVDVVCADGREVTGLGLGGFDRVLVDAPCTGLGSLRRRPEARWRRQPTDLPPLTRLQRELLEEALRAVRPGGVVAYVTCSPHQVETRVCVGEILRGHGGDLAALDARDYLPEPLSELGDGPGAQLWPHRHGTDAMYLALLRRVR
jgi:16S rRNA (cytosine967-C5)-methyltransferase